MTRIAKIYFCVFVLTFASAGAGCRSAQSSSANDSNETSSSGKVVATITAADFSRNSKKAFDPQAAKNKKIIALPDGSQYFGSSDSYGNLLEARYFTSGSIKYISLQTNADGSKVILVKKRDGALIKLAPGTLKNPWNDSERVIAMLLGFSPDYQLPDTQATSAPKITMLPVIPIQKAAIYPNTEPINSEPAEDSNPEVKPSPDSTESNSTKEKTSTTTIQPTIVNQSPRIILPSFLPKKKIKPVATGVE